MSNTPPDFGRPARSIAEYFYAGARGLDFPPPIFNTDHSGHGAYPSDVEATSQNRGRATQSSSSVNDGRSLRARDDDGSNRMKDNYKGRDMNPALEDFHHKRDSETLNVMPRTNEYDTYSNGYSVSDQTIRNFSNSKNLQPGSYPDRHYSHLQPHPPAMTGLQQFLPTRPSVYHQSSLDPAFSYNSMLSSLVKAQYEFNPYTRPNTGISQGYPGLGQTAPRLNLYPDFSTADPEMNFYNKKYPSMYPSSPLPVPAKPYEMDSHLMPRYHRNDEIPGYINNYPRTHSVPNKAYLGNVTDISRSQPAPSNGIKHGNNPIIDLTNPASPENFRNPQRSNAHLERSHARSNSHDSRSLPKENGNHQQAGTSGYENKSVKSHHYPHSSNSPYSNLLPYAPPQVVPPYSSAHLNHPENSLSDMRAFSKPIEPAKPIVHSPWGTPNKHHNSSPMQIGGSEFGKKSLSPSSHILSKDLSHTQSEITFNYPETSANRYEGKSTESRSTPAKRNSHIDTYSQGNEHDKYSSPALHPRSHSGNKSNESTLTAFEHYVIEKAREGKLPSTVLINRKFDDAETTCPPCPPKNHLPSIHSPKTDSKQNYEHEKNEIDDLRNSVIQPMVESSDNIDRPIVGSNETAIKENVEKTHQELDPVKSDFVVNSDNPHSMHVPHINVQDYDPSKPAGDDNMCTIQVPATNNVDQASCKNAECKQKKSVMNADGTPRVKRRYVKKSAVWDSKGKRKKKDSPNEISPKVSDSTNDTVESKPVTESATKVENVASTITVKHPAPSKLTRPQRKSTGLDMDEYLYGYVFSDEETENDDSSDEDYNCPINVNNKNKISRPPSKPLPRTRRSTRSQNDTVLEDEEGIEVEVTQRKRRRRRSKLNRTIDRNNAVEQDADTAENIESIPIQNPLSPQRLSDVVQPPVDKVCPESHLESSIITQEMAEEMVKQIDIVTEVNETLCDSATKTHIVPAVVQTNSIPLNELKIAVAPTEQVRTKRKYTRKLDENGNPVRRVRKIKSAETIPPKPRRKYEKKAKKWFKNKDFDQQLKPSTMGSNCEQNDTTPVEVTENLFEAKDPPPPAQVTTTDSVNIDEGHNACDKSASATRSEEHASTQPTKPVTVSEIENIAIDSNTNADSKCDSTAHDLRSSTTTEILNDKSSGPVEVKIRKKPGRKPGWRKYPGRDKETHGGGIATAASKLRKKYKNTGDGLKRFGRRKKSRRGKLRKNAVGDMEKYKPLQEMPITSTPTTSKCDNNNTSPTKMKRKYDNTRRLEKKRQRLMSSFEEKEVKRKQTPSAIATRNHTIHEISLELQSQEYLFDSKDVSWHHKVEGKEEVDPTNETIMEEPSQEAACSDHDFSKCETPVSTLTQSPFPSNMKKLTCNSAIGETMLHKAARLGYIENVQYYLESGANVNQCDNAGYTALHKACVHNNLEAASLLLEYGADVNKHAADGTRPFHDAVEYDHLEMTRLMLACGADPLLSKFSGRAVINMIRSEKMGKFMNAYLQELKEPTSETPPQEWKFQGSAIFEKQGNKFYKSLDFAPEVEQFSAEFELYDELPIPTYLLQPDDEHEWSNYYLLDDYLNCTNCKRNRKDTKVRIITMPTKKFLEQIRVNKVQCITYEKAKKPDISSSVIEIIAVDEDLTSSIGAHTITTPLFGKVKSLACSSLPPSDISEHKQSLNGKSGNMDATTQKHPGDDDLP